MFGSCRVCIEKDSRINDLLSQVEMLRKMAFPSQTALTPTVLEREMDLVISGSDEYVPASEEELEASRILTGAYDNAHTESY